MSYTRPDKIRQVAVLVASLDEQLATGLLSGLPAEEAAQVRQLADKLGEIDPEETADVFEQFRKSVQAAPVESSRTSADGYTDTVEIETSLADQFDRIHEASTSQTIATPPMRRDWATVGADAVGRKLADEHPQMIAVLLLRLPESQAVSVFNALPLEIREVVLQRLKNSAPADEQVLDELETHLAEWAQQQRTCEAHQLAGSQLAERLTAEAPPRHTVASHSKVPQTPPNRRPPPAGPRMRPSTPPVDPPEPAREPLLRFDPAGLESLDDQTLIAVLGEADGRSAQVALAASSERLVRRVLRRLPRATARWLREQLRALGPIPLAELDAAQQELLRLAHRRGATLQTR